MSKTERFVLTSALSVLLAPKLEALGLSKADQAQVTAAAAILIPSLYHVAANYFEQRAARRNPLTPAPVPAPIPPASVPLEKP